MYTHKSDEVIQCNTLAGGWGGSNVVLQMIKAENISTAVNEVVTALMIVQM